MRELFGSGCGSWICFGAERRFGSESWSCSERQVESEGFFAAEAEVGILVWPEIRSEIEGGIEAG